MPLSFARAVALVSLWSSAHSTPTNPHSPEAYWKNHTHDVEDLPSYGSPAHDGAHGPQDRGCWDGVYSIDTDMDIEWPDTGKTVKVG